MSYSLKQFLATTCITTAMLSMAATRSYANPQDGVVSAGNATIATSGNTLNIHQSTDRAVIDWRSFDIGATETTRFYQPSKGSVTLNRVNSTSPSFIDGNLIANGNVFIVNQNGVLFGQNSRVDVNGLVATTANISNANFMAGQFHFDQAGQTDATIENRGVITAGEAGLVGLVAPNVLNSGVIHAKLGRVHLASGDTATVDLYGDGLIEVGATDYTNQRRVENTGKITAEGGTIAMTAAAGAHMVNSLIRVSGELHAPSVGVKNGKIIIAAEGSNAVSGNTKASKGKKTGTSTVIVDGVLDVSGKQAGEKAGQITITADQVAVTSTAVIDATGSTGGGTVHIGGDYLGQGTTPAATYTIVQTGSIINASALDAGHGGEVIVYSDKTTEFGGTIIADGAGEAGNGGFAETSGRENLLAMGTVQLRAGRRGKSGTWLLDPADITVTAATNTNITGSPNFTASGTGSQVSAASIKLLLDAGTNVTIVTSNDGYAGNGDIIVSSAITTTGSGTLTLSAYRNITLSSAITLQGGSLTLRADNTGIGSGAILQNSGASIATNGGNITMGGGSGVITAGSGYATGNAASPDGVSLQGSVSAGGGNVIINGAAYSGSGSNRKGVYLSGSIVTTGTGTVTVNGTGTGSANAGFNNIGIWIVNGGSIVAQNGLVTLNGVDQTSGTGGSWGVYISPAGSSLVKTTGTGNINITGTGRNAAGGTAISLTVAGAVQATGSGSIVLKAVPGGAGVYATVANAVQTSSGNISIYSDNYSIGAAGAINSAGTLTAATYSNIGLSLGASVGGTVNIDTTTLGYLTAGSAYIFGSTVTGTGGANTSDVTVNTVRDFATKNVSFISGGNIVLAGNLTKATGAGSAAYLFQANGNITNSGLSGVAATTGSINLTFNSDYDQATSAGGYVTFTGGTFNTNGGSFTIGGGTNALTGNAYNAAGDGVTLTSSSVVSTGAGNISIRGESTYSSPSLGVSLAGSISTTSGTISVYGRSTSNNSSSRSIILNSTATVSSTTGNITFTGVNVSGNAGAYAFLMYNAGTTGCTVSSTSGNIVIDTTRGSNETAFGIVTSNTSTPALSTTNGNITILTDSRYMASSGTQISAANGTLTIAPKTNATMSLGSGGGTLNFSNAELAQMTAANYIFGSTTAGNLTVNTTRDFGDSNVSFLSGGNISLTSALAKATGTGTAAYLFQANGNISNTSGIGVTASSGAINLTLTSDYDVSGAGNISLANAGLLTNNGTITVNSNGQSVTVSGTIGGATTINSANGSVSIGTLDGTTAGTKDLTVNAGTGTFTTTGAIGATNKLNNLTVNSYDVALGANVTGSGTLTLAPTTTSTEVRINDATAAGTYTLSSTELGYMVDGWSGIVIGNAAGSGSMYIGTTTWVDPITFLNNYRVGMNGTITGTGNASVTFTVGGSGWINTNFAITTAGQNVTFNGTGIISGANNITTNGGNISATFVSVSSAVGSPTWSTSGGNITINNTLTRNLTGGSTSAKTFTMSAGTGNIVLSGTVNGDYSVSASGTTITTSGIWGATEALGNVTLTATNSISLPAMTTAAGKTINITLSGAGSSVTTTGALSVGAAGSISLTADDMILGGNLSGTGTLTIQQNSTSRNLKINNGTADGTNLNLSTAELGYFVDGWSQINIGNAAATVDTYIGSGTWLDPVTFRSNTRKYVYGFTGTGNASMSVTGGWIDLYGNITTAGGVVDFSGLTSYLYAGSNRTIATNGGNFLVKQLNINSGGGDLTVNTSGGNITVTDQIVGSSATGRVITLNAAAGNISFANTVNTQADITATGSTITLSANWGGSTALGNVTLTAVNSISLPAITTAAGKTLNVSVSGAGNSITTTGALSVGTAGNISLTADDLMLGANISGTGTLTLQPYSNGQGMNVGGTYGTPTAGYMTLSTTEIGYLVNGWSSLLLGKASGATQYTNVGTSSWTDPVTFRGWVQRLQGNLTGSGDASLTFTGYGTELNSGGTHSTAGQNVTFLTYVSQYWGNATINSNGGNITLSSFINSGIANIGTVTFNSGNGNISIQDIRTGSATSGTYVLNAGTGNVSIGSTVNTPANITASGTNITLGGAFGTTTPVGNVTITAVNSVSVPAITTAAGKTVDVTVSGAGNSITTTGAIATGTGGSISLKSDDLSLGGNLSGTGTVTLQPYAASRMLRVNNGTADGTNFNLSTAEVAYLVDGWTLINIGNSANSVTSYIGSTTWTDPVNFRSSAGRIVYGAVGTGNATITFSGAASWVDLYGDITTSGGFVDFSGVNYFYLPASGPATKTISTSGGNVLLKTMYMSGSDLVLNAGGGSISFGGTTSGPRNITASANSMTFSGVWGGATALGNVALTSVNSIALPSISASTILVRTTGAASDLSLASGSVLTASSGGNAITLASGRNIINSSGSSTPFNLTGGGRFLLYSTNPSNDTLGGITGNFVRYGCTYGGSCPSGVTIPASGNGLIYTYRPTITVTPTATSAIYGDTANLTGYAYAATGYLTGAAGNDALLDTLGGTLTGTSSYAQGSSIGTYNIDYASGSLTSSLGYLINYANNASALTVNKRTLTVSLTGSVNKVYDGTTAATLDASNYALGNFYGTDESTVTVATTSGTYDDKTAVSGKTVSVSGMTLTGANSGNYQLASTSASGVIGSITRKVLTIIGLTGQDRVYDGTVNAGLNGTASLSGVVGIDDVGISVVGSGVFADKNAGSGKTITVSGYDISGTDATNYNLVQPTGLTADVTKKNLTVTSANQTVTYGTSVPTTTIGYSGFISGEDETVLGTAPTVTSARSGIVNAGTYAGNYALGGGSDGNYSFTYIDGTLTVNKKSLNVTADGQTVTYGDATPGTSTLTYNGFITGEDETNLITAPTVTSGASGPQNAGTYSNNYVASGSVSNNYSFNYIGGDLVVSKRNLAVSVDNKSVSYGTAVPSGSVSYSGFVLGQDESVLLTLPTISSAVSGVVNAGTYTGNYTASGGVAANYNLIYSPGNLTVTKVGLNVTVNNRGIIYGTAVGTSSLTYTGFVNGDNASVLLTLPTISSANSGIVNVGSYIGNYTASGASALNYTFNYIDGNLTVSPKVLNVTAGNRTITYGDSLTLPTLTYSGFISGEDETVLGTAPIVTSARSGIVNAGTYAGNYMVSGGVSGNYTFNYVGGNLVVTKKNLVVRADDKTIAQGSVVPVGTFTYSGFVNGEDSSVLNTLPVLTSGLSGRPAAGTYSGNYALGGAVDDNYSFTYVRGDLTVTSPTAEPRSETISALPNTYVYESHNPSFFIASTPQNISGPRVTFEIAPENNHEDQDGVLAIFDRSYQGPNVPIVITITPELAREFLLTGQNL